MNIIIQPVSIALNRDANGRYYIYASRFDIMCDSEDTVYKITKSLEAEGIFGFNTMDTYSGFDNKFNMYVVSDAGRCETMWFVTLLHWISAVKQKGIDIQLNISKSVLQKYNIEDYSATNNKIAATMQEMMITAYIGAVIKFTKANKLSDFIVTKVKDTKSSIKINTTLDKFYIV